MRVRMRRRGFVFVVIQIGEGKLNIRGGGYIGVFAGSIANASSREM